MSHLSSGFMTRKKKLIILPFAAAVGFSAAGLIAPNNLKSVSADVSTTAGLRFVGRWTSGSGLGGAEISAYDPATSRLFVTNGKTNQIDIVDISRPQNPVKVKSIDLASKGVTGVQSVATKNGLVAVAASVGGNNQANGKVFLTDTNGVAVKGAEDGIGVGALPDHVSFSTDGRYVLTADEGEPQSYCKAADGSLPKTTDPYGSVSIIDVGGTTPSAATIVNFESYNDRATSLVFQGGRVFGPGASLAQDLEPEYIAVSPDSKYAYVTLQENNSVATIDLATKTVKSIVGLGFKKHSELYKGIDAVSDGGPNVAQPNVLGMYQPDAIATITGPDGLEYLVTANEGDARSYPCLLGGTDTAKAQDEEAKLSGVADTTDTVISDVAKLVPSLGVTPFAPANPRLSSITSSTKVKTAYSFGARSISVWQPENDTEGVDTMTQVWDSGDQLEQLIARLRPTFFNADWDTTSGLIKSVDARSTKKGPEPEGVAVGEAYGKTWIAAGLERDGGVVLYDASIPRAPVLIDYVNTSVPSGNLTAGTAGDVSPEGILFVSPDDSPTDSALVIVSYELSGTVGIYEIPRKTPSEPRKVKATAAQGFVSLRFEVPTVPGWAGDITYTARCSVVGDKGVLVGSARKSPLRVAIPRAMSGSPVSCTVSSASSLGMGLASKRVVVTTK